MLVSTHFFALLQCAFAVARHIRHDAFLYDPGFDIKKVAAVAEALPSHSWEFGTASEALLELYNPEYSVFGTSAFPVPSLDKTHVKSLAYVEDKIVVGKGQNALRNGEGATGDPASLGVSALLLGVTDKKMANAATEEINYLLRGAPRFSNGAISHRTRVPELWADFIYMAPPFIAYYAVANNNASLLSEAVHQCDLYRQILQANTTEPSKGAWMHIIGPESQDTGFWCTGNGWAAAGMTRVLATVIKAPSIFSEAHRRSLIDQLTRWIKEIIEGARHSPNDGSLLRNYLDDVTTGRGFGDISCSTLLASVVYRMAVLLPDVFGQKHLDWADSIRAVLGQGDRDGNPHVTDIGVVTPAVNPLNWFDIKPYTTGSPEGQNFVVLMYAAWRDCVDAQICDSRT